MRPPTCIVRRTFHKVLQSPLFNVCRLFKAKHFNMCFPKSRYATEPNLTKDHCSIADRGSRSASPDLQCLWFITLRLNWSKNCLSAKPLRTGRQSCSSTRPLSDEQSSKSSFEEIFFVISRKCHFYHVHLRLLWTARLSAKCFIQNSFNFRLSWLGCTLGIINLQI